MRELSGLWRRAGLALVALALVAAQTLGHVHGVAHGLPHQPAAPAAQGLLQHGGHGGVASLLHGLFDPHGDGAACRLYDQMGHGDSLPAVAAVLLPMAPPAALFALLQGQVLARHAALFDARAPPSVR